MAAEPVNLGPGRSDFDFEKAFGAAVRIINDAALQALGSYEGGRMLFLGLGTALGSTQIPENVIVPMELGELQSTVGLLYGEWWAGADARNWGRKNGGT